MNGFRDTGTFIIPNLSIILRNIEQLFLFCINQNKIVQMAQF